VRFPDAHRPVSALRQYGVRFIGETFLFAAHFITCFTAQVHQPWMGTGSNAGAARRTGENALEQVDDEGEMVLISSEPAWKRLAGLGLEMTDAGKEDVKLSGSAVQTSINCFRLTFLCDLTPVALATVGCLSLARIVLTPAS